MYKMTRQRYTCRQREFVKEVFLSKSIMDSEKKWQFINSLSETSNYGFIFHIIHILNGENCGYLFPDGMGIENVFYVPDTFAEYNDSFDGVNCLIGGLE